MNVNCFLDDLSFVQNDFNGDNSIENQPTTEALLQVIVDPEEQTNETEREINSNTSEDPLDEMRFIQFCFILVALIELVLLGGNNTIGHGSLLTPIN